MKKRGECAYCGKIGSLTRDHIFPKCLFPEPYPVNIDNIVRVCQACNNKKSQDDDFLRDWLTSDIIGSQCMAARKVFQKVLRSDLHGSSEIGTAARTKMRYSALHTNGGLYLGHYPSFRIDGTRVNYTFSRIVKALYRLEHKERLPDDYTFDVRRFFPYSYRALFKDAATVGCQKPKFLADVAGYTHNITQEDRFTSVWLIWVYNVVFEVIVEGPDTPQDIRLASSPS
jgi:hypothetical protein